MKKTMNASMKFDLTKVAFDFTNEQCEILKKAGFTATNTSIQDVPDGWELKYDADCNQYNLVDNQGRVRAEVFEDENHKVQLQMKYFYKIVILMNHEMTEYMVLVSNYKFNVYWQSPTYLAGDMAAEQDYLTKAADYLKKNFPESEDVLAYWD